MASLLKTARQVASLLPQCTTASVNINQLTIQLHKLSLKPAVFACSRWSSNKVQNLPELPHMPNEGPYPKYEETPSPFRPLFWRRYGYKPQFYAGGILPRPKEFEDKPLPKGKSYIRKSWTKQSALFGQNDYIDILGDGKIHPYQLMTGPKWLKGFHGNEFQRLRKQLLYEGEMLKEYYPNKHHDIRKRMFFLYKRINRRKRARFWAGKKGTAWTRSRFFKLDKIF